MPAPVISVAQMRQWEEATWASGQTQEAVMRLAGKAVARRAGQLARPGDLVVVLAGKGHNGDDARFAAESEHLTAREVRLVRVADPQAALEETRALLQRRPALIIDGLFGIGLNRPLAQPWIELIQEINRSELPILAVDVPSGLNAATGEPMDDAIRADYTVTFGAVKEGMLKPAAAPFIGSLEVAANIGLSPCPFKSRTNFILAEDFTGFPPKRPPEGHKGTFGHLVLVAGSLGYHGASVLAARGAQRAQPGLITLFTAPEVYVPVAAQLQSVMVRPWSEGLELPATCTALAIGPGLAAADEPIRDFCRHAWKTSSLAMIVDASALEWLPDGPFPANALRVITPHPGEAARLFGTRRPQGQGARAEAARRLSLKFGGCMAVLKGRQTIIETGQDTQFVNGSGNAFLAQGGSGDLLTGYLGGLLAQPGLRADPVKTISYGVWQHGTAAEALLICRRNWTIEDLTQALGNAV